jgi:hypothetical protein
MGTTWAFSKVAKNYLKNTSGQSPTKKLNITLAVSKVPTSFITEGTNKMEHTMFPSGLFLSTENNGKKYV